MGGGLWMVEGVGIGSGSGSGSEYATARRFHGYWRLWFFYCTEMVGSEKDALVLVSFSNLRTVMQTTPYR